MSTVRENCRRILERIHGAATRAGRNPEAVQLIAVTKSVGLEPIQEALESGIRHIGENRLQEALPKREALHNWKAFRPTWHFIGRLQTNKAKKVVENFDWIQSLDRLDLAEKLNHCSAGRLPVLIEVKLQNEPAKSGIAEPELSGFIEALRKYTHLDVRGFMAVPPFFDNPEESRPYFRRLHELGRQFGLPELSMGMSNDFEVAVEEGATMVRVGTALFGDRPK